MIFTWANDEILLKNLLGLKSSHLDAKKRNNDNILNLGKTMSSDVKNTSNLVINNDLKFKLNNKLVIDENNTNIKGPNTENFNLSTSNFLLLNNNDNKAKKILLEDSNITEN